MAEVDTEVQLEKMPVGARQTTLWGDVVRRLSRNRLAIVGLTIVVTLVILATVAPLISPYWRAVGFYPDRTLQPPSLEHPMGTDDLGRDVMARVVWSSRVSVEVGFIAVGIGLVIGLLLGAASGYFGGAIDSLIMRSADVFFAFPFILGALAIMTILGPGLLNILIAVGILEWAYFARLFRSSTLSVKENDYVEAARAVGAGNMRIIWRHIFPNAISPVVIYAAMSVGGAILAEAALSFLGIGVQPPQPSWGLMLAESRQFMGSAPWMMYFPGLAIFVTVLGFVLLADGLRDALDPRLR